MGTNDVLERILEVIADVTVTDDMDYEDEASEYWAAIQQIERLAKGVPEESVPGDTTS